MSTVSAGGHFNIPEETILFGVPVVISKMAGETRRSAKMGLLASCTVDRLPNVMTQKRERVVVAIIKTLFFIFLFFIPPEVLFQGVARNNQLYYCELFGDGKRHVMCVAPSCWIGGVCACVLNTCIRTCKIVRSVYN